MNKKVISLLLVFILVISVFAGCKKDEKNDGMFYVDDEGVTHYVQVDDDGKYYQTDDDGNKVYVEDEKVNQQIEENREEAERNEILGEINTDPDKVFDNADKNDGLEMSDDLVENEIVTVPTVDAKAEAAKRMNNYLSVLKTNKYTIDAMVKEIGGDNLEYPMVIIRSGNNAFVKTAIPFEEGKVIKANMIILDGITYCEIPSIKTYMEMSDMGIEDLSEGTLSVDDIMSYMFVESGVVTINGKKYNCDVYQDGVDTIKYYFDTKGNLVRIEEIGKRESTITEIKSIKNTADESKIKKPKGINITSIVGEM